MATVQVQTAANSPLSVAHKKVTSTVKMAVSAPKANANSAVKSSQSPYDFVGIAG